MLCYNGRELTLDCLASLSELRWHGGLTTIVVDNGSRDGTAEAVRERFPGVTLIRSEHNLGFAEGNNLGLRRALDLGCDYALLLNNDTVVDPDMMSELVRAAESRPDAGALCPLVYFADPPDLVWYAGAAFDPARGYGDPHVGYRVRDVGQFSEVVEVGRAVGAAMLVPRAVMERVGLLDGGLFLLVEDVDWSLRMRAAGYRLYLVPGAKVWHRVSAASGGEHSPTLAYYGVRNRLEICRRHALMKGIPGLRRQLGIVAAELIHARRAKRRAQNVRAVLAGWRDYLRGRTGPRAATVPRASTGSPRAAADAS